MRLPCVEKIPAKNRERHSRHDAAGYQVRGKAAEWRQPGDEQQIREAAEEQPEETVQITGDKPSPRLARRGACGDDGGAQAVPYFKPILVSHCRYAMAVRSDRKCNSACKSSGSNSGRWDSTIGIS